MRRSTALIRIRFPIDVIERVDRRAEELRVMLGRKVPRAALIRALVQIHVDAAEDRAELVTVIEADSVRRGRQKRSRPTVQ